MSMKINDENKSDSELTAIIPVEATSTTDETNASASSSSSDRNRNPILDAFRRMHGIVAYSVGLQSKTAALDVKLPVKVKLGYGVGDLAGNLFYTIIEFWLMYFYTDVAGIPPVAAGSAILVGKLFDALADPITGYLSDRTRTKWGRRRPWMLFGSVPLLISTFLLFSNVMTGWSDTGKAVWAGFIYIVATISNTVVNIPYCALTPDMTEDFDERTSLTSYRMAFAAIATLIGAALTLEIVKLMPTRTGGFMFMGGLFGVIMLIATLIAFHYSREKLFPTIDEENSALKQYWQVVSKNKPYLVLLLVWVLVNVAVTIVTTVLPYYFRYIHLDEDKMSVAVAVMIVTALLCIPLTNYCSARFGKRNTYACGLLLFTLGTMIVFGFSHTINPPTKEWDGNFYFTLALMLVTGAGFSTQYVLPWAMIPDTIEYDYAMSGCRREGLYYSIWNFMITACAALAAFMVGGVLSAFGYAANQPQSDLSQLGIRLLVGPFTAIFAVGAIVTLFYYPLDKKMYAETLERIKDMEKKNARVEL